MNLCGLLLLSALAAPGQTLETGVVKADLDTPSFATWVDGVETSTGLPERGPNHVVWCADSRPEWRAVTFGDTKSPGPRHLRIGFTKPLDLGSVLVRGGGSLSVLKPTSAWPGRLDVEDDWLPAERLVDGRVSRAEVAPDGYALWVLPPGTAARALRFTHHAAVTDPDYAGWLGGVCVLAARLADVAPLALAAAASETHRAEKLIDGTNDGLWKTWDNGAEGRATPLSDTDPETVTLIWPTPVTLRGLNPLWIGFSACAVDAYSGPADRHPRQATEADWQPLGTFEKLASGYPLQLWPNWLDFGQDVTTRAIRLRITAVTAESHPHLKGKTRDGRRIWMGELMALQPLGDQPLSAVATGTEERDHLPIGIPFRLPEDGYVTLVIERPDGVRVRNLVGEQWFPAGDNMAWWDGTDDLGRDVEAARHGLYHIPERFVPPGEYRVRGLWHGAVGLKYEFTVYNDGTPPWETADKSGGWLTNHTPPSSAVYVPDAGDGQPAVLLGSYVAEGGAGLAWVGLDGRKRNGQGWVGGNWTGAPYLAHDAGPDAVEGVYAYVGSAWDAQLRLTAIGAKQEAVFAAPYAIPWSKEKGDHPVDRHLAGLAAHDGILVCALKDQDKLLLVDARKRAATGEIPLPSPRGLAFDGQGRLLALSGTTLVRFEKAEPGAKPRMVVQGLEDPQGMTVDGDGAIYVSDRGGSHQVKVYDAAGKLLRSVGQVGPPRAGPYDPLHLNNPRGIAVDANGRLWVAEEDYQPKRVSVWNPDGSLWKAFYGPGEYGGGGRLDPRDKTRFYYHGMEFRLDWEQGSSRLDNVFWRPGGDVPDGHHSAGLPERPIYLGRRQYLTNEFDSNPTGGTASVTIWLLDNGLARPVAAMGRTANWSLLADAAYRDRWPVGLEPNDDYWNHPGTFAWSDRNGDGQPQPDEVTIVAGAVGGLTVADDLSVLASRMFQPGQPAKTVRFRPVSIAADGVPSYDPSRPETLADGVLPPASSGGDQALMADGWTVVTLGLEPFARQSLSGATDGRARWSFPSLWPGLHASHEAPVPDRPGMVIGTTRLLGSTVEPMGSAAGPLWLVNGNHGNAYVFTADGLFVAQLFQDMRIGERWAMPVEQRGMDLGHLTLHDENFWPSVTQTADGAIYLVDGRRMSLVRVDGLETIRRLPDASLTLTAAELDQSRTWFAEREAKRQAEQGSGVLTVQLRDAAPTVDGQLDDWSGAAWVDIDRRGTAAYFNSNSKPYDVQGAVSVAGDRLYAAWRTGNAELLRNSGEVPEALFKCGGALDLMIGADATADPQRAKPVAGDQRLLVTLIDGQPRAMLYQSVVPGTERPVPFSSPWRTITIDQVVDVTDHVTFAGQDGNFEISAPLELLRLKPAPGMAIQGDIGILRGDGDQTQQRVYWSNKATAIVADVPSEAELTPRLWGRWEIGKPGQP